MQVERSAARLSWSAEFTIELEHKDYCPFLFDCVESRFDTWELVFTESCPGRGRWRLCRVWRAWRPFWWWDKGKDAFIYILCCAVIGRQFSTNFFLLIIVRKTLQVRGWESGWLLMWLMDWSNWGIQCEMVITWICTLNSLILHILLTFSLPPSQSFFSRPPYNTAKHAAQFPQRGSRRSIWISCSNRRQPPIPWSGVPASWFVDIGSCGVILRCEPNPDSMKGPRYASRWRNLLSWLRLEVRS